MLIKQHAPTTMALHLRWLFATDDDRMVPVCVRMHCMFAILPGIYMRRAKFTKICCIKCLTFQWRRSVQNIFVILSTVVLVLRISFVFFECYAIATEVATVSILSIRRVLYQFQLNFVVCCRACVCVCLYMRESKSHIIWKWNNLTVITFSLSVTGTVAVHCASYYAISL